jgi:uncharacterized RDD family membrane protein YckC
VAVVAWGQVATQARALQARQARIRRFGALVIDLMVFSVMTTFINNVYGVTQVTGGTLPTGQNGSFSYSTVTAVAWPLLVLLWLAYYLVLEGLYGASIGKMLLGLCVVRLDAQPLGITSIVRRNLFRLVDVLPAGYLIGGLSVLLSGGSQRLGDMVAGTTVVRRDDALESWATRHPPRGSNRLLAAALVVAALFTIGFDYFGRPPLVLEGLYNEHRLLDGVSSYSLGPARWSTGHVSYPFTMYKGAQACSGTFDMDWQWTGWELGSASYVCKD